MPKERFQIATFPIEGENIIQYRELRAHFNYDTNKALWVKCLEVTHEIVIQKKVQPESLERETPDVSEFQQRIQLLEDQLKENETTIISPLREENEKLKKQLETFEGIDVSALRDQVEQLTQERNALEISVNQKIDPLTESQIILDVSTPEMQSFERAAKRRMEGELSETREHFIIQMLRYMRKFYAPDHPDQLLNDTQKI